MVGSVTFANFTVTVFVNAPSLAALYVTFIVPVLPFIMGVSGYSGFVHPHPATADSITTALSEVLVNLNSVVTGLPCSTFPNECLISLNSTGLLLGVVLF